MRSCVIGSLAGPQGHSRLLALRAAGRLEAGWHSAVPAGSSRGRRWRKKSADADDCYLRIHIVRAVACRLKASLIPFSLVSRLSFPVSSFSSLVSRLSFPVSRFSFIIILQAGGGPWYLAAG